MGMGFDGLDIDNVFIRTIQRNEIEFGNFLLRRNLRSN